MSGVALFCLCLFFGVSWFIALLLAITLNNPAGWFGFVMYCLMFVWTAYVCRGRA